MNGEKTFVYDSIITNAMFTSVYRGPKTHVYQVTRPSGVEACNNRRPRVSLFRPKMDGAALEQPDRHGIHFRPIMASPCDGILMGGAAWEIANVRKVTFSSAKWNLPASRGDILGSFGCLSSRYSAKTVQKHPGPGE